MTTKFNYSRIKIKKTDRLNEIVKSTKDMIINSSKFNNYLNEYISAIQIPSFKTPEISCYPLLKNFFLIPLNRMHSYEEEQKQRVSRPASCLKIHKNSKGPHPLPNLSTSKDYVTKKLNNDSMMNVKGSNSNQKKRIRIKSSISVSMATNERGLNRDNSNFRRGSLINAFFPDWSFGNDLVYDESDLFNKEDYYKKFINDKMNYIKENNIENMTSVISSKFNEETNREMTLTLSSMKIEFKNKTNDKKKPIVIYLPFAYLFLFYYQGIEYFQHILLGIIKFNDDNGNDQIILDEQCLYEVLRSNPTLLNVNTNSNSNCTEENSKENSNKGDGTVSNRTKHHHTTGKKDNMADHQSIGFSSKKEPRHFNTLSQNAYNNYSFTWLAMKNIYQINISLPEICFVLKKSQINVSRYIDKELILFLLEKNFINWDFYVINLLFSLKDFRRFIEKMLSKKKPSNANSTNNSNSNVTNSSSSSTNALPTSLAKQRSLSNLDFKHLSSNVELSRIKSHDFSLEDYTFSYFYSAENEKNSLHVLHSYSVNVFFSKLKPIKKFPFDFTFKQMFILNQILIQTGNLEAFIMKILITDSSIGVIQLNYAFFDHYDETIFKDEEKYEIIGDKSNKTNIKGIEILIDKPYLIRIFSDSPYRSSDVMTVQVSSEMISDLDGRDLSQWPLILMNQTESRPKNDSDCKRKNSKLGYHSQSSIYKGYANNIGETAGKKKSSHTSQIKVSSFA